MASSRWGRRSWDNIVAASIGTDGNNAVGIAAAADSNAVGTAAAAGNNVAGIAVAGNNCWGCTDGAGST